jgi:hypothetical protein
MPGVPHRYCVMHLWRNFTKQWKEKELRGVVWECARATTPTQFNRIMERVKRINEKAWEYLNKWPKEAWTKAYFILPHSWVSFCLTCRLRLYDLLMPQNWVAFAYVISQTYDL